MDFFRKQNVAFHSIVTPPSTTSLNRLRELFINSTGVTSYQFHSSLSLLIWYDQAENSPFPPPARSLGPAGPYLRSDAYPGRGFKYMKVLVTTDSSSRTLSTNGGSIKDEYQSRMNGEQRAHSRPMHCHTLHSPCPQKPTFLSRLRPCLIVAFPSRSLARSSLRLASSGSLVLAFAPLYPGPLSTP